MFSDARDVERGSTIDADVCIVGAGVAGITIAREFIGRPERVVLLEGGGLGFTKSLRRFPTIVRRHAFGEQALASGRNVGYPYYPLRFTRARAFGGSSRAWSNRGLHAHPLDAIDFETRDGLPEHGWPIDRAQLDACYRRAQEICGLGPFAYDPGAWAGEVHGGQLPLDPNLVRTEIFQFGEQSKFDRYEEDVAQAENVNLVLHANAVHIADEAGPVERIECMTLSGNRFGVRAKTFVLAMGAIETARLLLVSRDRNPAGVGNANDLVGRYFMEHPDMAVGYLIPDPQVDPETFALYELQRVGEHLKVEGMLRLGDEVLRSEGLLNGAVRLRPTYHTGTAPAVESAQVLRRSAHFAVPTRGLARHAFTSLLGARSIIRHYATWRSRRPPEIYGIDVMAEQAPSADSRITLGQKRDRLGLPLTVVDWRLAEIDYRSIRTTVDILAEAVHAAGLGIVRSTVGGRGHPPPVFGNWHHLGTTRMHRDPARGVVDQNSRVHDVDNLYVAGGSVFPTGGYANPSLTIVALALRLADHLKSTLA